MSNSGTTTVTVTVTITIVAYSSTGFALPLLASAVFGVYLSYLIAAGVGVIALITFFMTIKNAVEARDLHWLFDIAAAPILASVLSWLLYTQYLSLINNWLGFVNAGPAQGPNDGSGGAIVVTLVHVVLYLAIIVVAFCAVVGAPIAAIAYMNSEEFYVRALSYLAYAFTAFYWQTGVIAVSRGQASW